MYVQYNVFIVAIHNTEHIIQKILLKFNSHTLKRLLNTINFNIEHQFEYKF